VIFGVALPILLPRVFGLDGLLYSFPLADILTFLIALVVIARVYRELSAKSAAQPHPDSLAVKRRKRLA
jgi:Na+-driven multidrug efflux pump